MSHIQYRNDDHYLERWSIDRENVRFCVRTKCPHLSFGTCLKPRCILKRRGKNVNLCKLS